MATSYLITRKGQITIPAEIRHALGLKEGDRVCFALAEGTIVVRPARSVAERTYGAIETARPPMTAEELREAAMEAVAASFEERSADAT